MNLPAHKKMLSAAAAASVLLLTAACGSSDSDGAAANAATSAPATADATTDPGTDSSSTAAYKDGDYTAEGDYVSPAGPSHVSVELTIADGVISDVSVTPEATNSTSKQFQTLFAGGISVVVGKSLDEANVSKVAGSSLTSGGFNDAIEKIKAEAKS